MSKFKTPPIRTQLICLGLVGLVALVQQKAENTCIKIYPDMVNHFDKYTDCVVKEGGYEPVQAKTVPGEEKSDLVTPQSEIEQQVIILETKTGISQADKDAIARDKAAQEAERLRNLDSLDTQLPLRIELVDDTSNPRGN